jgi:hypothetical protein
MLRAAFLCIVSGGHEECRPRLAGTQGEKRSDARITGLSIPTRLGFPAFAGSTGRRYTGSGGPDDGKRRREADLVVEFALRKRRTRVLQYVLPELQNTAEPMTLRLTVLQPSRVARPFAFLGGHREVQAPPPAETARRKARRA